MAVLVAGTRKCMVYKAGKFDFAGAGHIGIWCATRVVACKEGLEDVLPVLARKRNLMVAYAQLLTDTLCITALIPIAFSLLCSIPIRHVYTNHIMSLPPQQQCDD